MPESFAGEVRNGVVVFLDGAPPLPEGTKVQIKPVAADDATTPTLADRLRAVVGSAKGLPADLAGQHDHYLHGTPKR